MIRPRRIRRVRQRMSQRGDRLRGLAQPHVVGQEQAARAPGTAPRPRAGRGRAVRFRPLIAAFISAGGQRLLHDPFQPLALAGQQGAERRVGPDDPVRRPGGPSAGPRRGPGASAGRPGRFASATEAPSSPRAEPLRATAARRAPPFASAGASQSTRSSQSPDAGQGPDRVPAQPGRGRATRRAPAPSAPAAAAGAWRTGARARSGCACRRPASSSGSRGSRSAPRSARRRPGRAIRPDVRLPPLRRVRAEQVPVLRAWRRSAGHRAWADSSRRSRASIASTPHRPFLGRDAPAARAGPGRRPGSWGSSGRRVPGASRTPRSARPSVRAR